MCQPRKWWWGLLPLVALFGLMMGLTRGPIEGDLAVRSAEVFKASGLPWAKATIAGRDAVVSGEAPNAESQKLALTAAERAWGVRQVADATKVAADIKPYTASATRDGAKITLSGFVPNDPARTAVVTAAKAAFPNAQVVDELKFGNGAPAVYAPAMAFGLAQLGKLTKGVASLSDSAFSIAGQAADFAGLDAVTAAVRQLPQGATLAKAEITAPRVSPYTFSATKSDASLSLSGFIPTEAARAPLVAASKAAGDLKVTDSLRVADGLPTGVDFGKASEFVFGQLGKLKSGVASLKDDALSIAGQADTVANFDAVTSALKGALPGGLKLAAQDIKGPTPIAPYIWSANRGASGITLSGHVPSETVRTSILDQVKRLFAGVTVTDQMTLAPGAAAGFANHVSTGLNYLSKMKTGVAGLRDDALTLSGQTDDVGVYETLTNALKGALPDGLKLASQDIKGPAPVSPYVWSATHAPNGVTLAGSIPSEASRGPIVDATKKAFPGKNVIDQMKVALGAPAGFVDAITASLGQLSKLGSGVATITNTAIRVTGEAATKAIADSLKSPLSGLPANFAFTSQLTFKEPPPPAPEPPRAEPVIPPAPVAPTVTLPRPPIAMAPSAPTEAEICQIKFREILDKDTIHFATASARITRESQSVLKLLADAVKACRTMSVEIQGHTDTDGTSEANLDLSNRRAAAVVKALEELGVSEARMTAKGYGETQPVAPNDTAENKAKNRRIDFVVAK